MQTLERFLGLLFGAIVVMLVLTNPQGIKAIGDALTGFTARTVQAFRGGTLTLG